MTTTTVSSRQTGKVISQIVEANQIISLTEPSVVTINQPAGWATGYSRSGDDLTLDTQAGTLHYNNFFSAGSSTLVFDDGAAPATQAVFSSNAADSSLTPVFTAYHPATASGPVAQAAAVQAEEGITFDPITGDDILYADETSGEITITGHAPVSAQGGTIVVTAFEDPAYSYTGTVAADGSWQVTVPEYDFSGAPNGIYTLVAALTAPDGTVTTATHDVTLNQRPFEGYLYFYSLTGDGVLTPDEQAQGMLIEGAFINDSGLYGDHYAVTITLTDNTNAQSFTYTTTLGEDGY